MQSNRKGLSSVARQSFIEGLFATAIKKGAHVFHLRPNGVTFDELKDLAFKWGLVASQSGEHTMLAVVRPQSEAA